MRLYDDAVLLQQWRTHQAAIRLYMATLNIAVLDASPRAVKDNTIALTGIIGGQRIIYDDTILVLNHGVH